MGTWLGCRQYRLSGQMQYERMVENNSRKKERGILGKRKRMDFYGFGRCFTYLSKGFFRGTYFAVNFIKCVELFLPVRTKKQVTFELTPEDL